MKLKNKMECLSKRSDLNKSIFTSKAFTLIELIVVIAILGILVLLASPKFLGYTQKAQHGKSIANARMIQDASQVYYMDNQKWPKLGGENAEHYTPIELAEFSEKIYDITGKEFTIDPNGKYYDIDYEALNPYVKVVDDKKNYILQNPVGKIYYMENLLEPGENRVEYADNNGTNKEDSKESQPIRTEDEITEEEIIIKTADDLAKIGADNKFPLTGKYVQMADIDLLDYQSGEGWKPIGDSNNSFTGSFDGNGFKITNLKINRSTDYNGLFGRIVGSQLSNISLEGIDINGGQYTGGLVGRANEASKIINSYTTGEVIGTGTSVGGLVGLAGSSSEITDSSATGSVKGTSITGGLVGFASSSAITNSYSTGSVSGTDRVGGLVGKVSSSVKITNSYATGSVNGKTYTGGLVGRVGSSSVIIDSYATGLVSGTDRVGGLVGSVENSAIITNSYATGSVTGTGEYIGGLVGFANSGTITNSYATGPVTGTGSSVGGLVGWTQSSSKIMDSYYDMNTTNRSGSAGGTGLTTAQMKEKTNFEGWDFDKIWAIDEGSYPYLISNPQSPAPGM